MRVTFGEPANAPESLRGLDTTSRARLGCLSDRVDTSGAVLVIDHHATSERFGTHHLLNSEAEATVVLALRLIDALHARLDVTMARCLYAGVVTNTSCFSSRRRGRPGRRTARSAPHVIRDEPGP